jgi:hypothetical protein
VQQSTSRVPSAELTQAALPSAQEIAQAYGVEVRPMVAPEPDVPAPKGRGLFATRDFKKDDVIFLERKMVGVQSYDCPALTCEHVRARARAAVACRSPPALALRSASSSSGRWTPRCRCSRTFPSRPCCPTPKNSRPRVLRRAHATSRPQRTLACDLTPRVRSGAVLQELRHAVLQQEVPLRRVEQGRYRCRCRPCGSRAAC